MNRSVKSLARRPLAPVPVVIVSLFLLLSVVRLAFGQEQIPEQGPSAPTELFIYGTNFRDPLGDVPQSTTVVQEERFTEKGETNFQYEIESIPNLTWSGGSSPARRPTMPRARGRWSIRC